jgi:hypothetical protein
MTKNTLLLILVFLLKINIQTYACVNEYWDIAQGKLHVHDYEGSLARIPNGNNLQHSVVKNLFNQIKERYKKNPSLENYSDYAASLIYQGAYEKGKNMLLDIEAKSPHKYNTAANIGTAYELLGKNDSALFWIKKSVEINFNSHYGSEWIHVRLLEDKIKAQNTEGYERYFDTHSILGWDFGTGKKAKDIQHLDLAKFATHLYYQLTERMTFIKGKDPIIAQLAFDLGNIYSAKNDHRTAAAIYDIARTYGYKGDLFKKRLAYSEDAMGQSIVYRPDGTPNNQEEIDEKKGDYSAGLWISGLAFIGFILGLYKLNKA